VGEGREGWLTTTKRERAVHELEKKGSEGVEVGYWYR